MESHFSETPMKSEEKKGGIKVKICHQILKKISSPKRRKI
jgi:hypothetical protein